MKTTWRKYSPEIVKEAIRMYKTGKYSVRSIARYLKFSDSSVLWWYLNPKKRILQYQKNRIWQKNNREKKLEHDREYYRTHREKFREYARRFREKHVS